MLLTNYSKLQVVRSYVYLCITVCILRNSPVVVIDRTQIWWY